MDFYMKLPRNIREFIIFLAIISIISVNIIAPLISCFEMGFSLRVWREVMKVLPFIWLSVVALVLLTYRPGMWLTSKISDRGDSFHAHITINILCNVFLMSILLTVIGTWIGSGRISPEPIRLFFYKWPRNFALSFAVELLIAQPIGHWVMTRIHSRKDGNAPDIPASAEKAALPSRSARP